MTRKRIGGKEPYARVYASAKDHPRHLQAGLAAEGLWKRAMAYCADHMTDGVVPASWVEVQGPKKVIAAGTDAGLWEKIGTVYVLHDYLDHNRSKEQVDAAQKWERNKKALHRDRDLVAAVRERDGDMCRYCATLVNWSDKRGPTGGTYDHVIPRGPNVLDNIVVACRRCNTDKSCRTPDQAGMTLIPVNSDLAPIQLRPGSESVNGVGIPRDSVTQLHSTKDRRG